MKDEKKLLQSIIPLLVEWYQINQRKLPWRKEVTPYQVWISETMLQQTRIEAVIPYYQRFLKELPTVEALAAVESDKLMKLWEGLGYYSRARNLKKAAEILLLSYKGQLPEQASELRKLPGIGDYTAGAIASIAFGQPEPAVDGNVLRVVMRLTACDDDIMQPGTKKQVVELLRAAYPTGQQAADLTQGLMELGETICIPNGSPKCLICPLQSYCRANRKRRVADYPVKSSKKRRKIEERTVLLLSSQGKYAIHRRERTGLLAGMWELPNREGNATPAQVVEFLSEQGIETISCKPCGEAKHVFTHVEWHMHGYVAECNGESEHFLWKNAEEIQEEYAIPSAFRFYTRLMTKDVPRGLD